MDTTSSLRIKLMHFMTEVHDNWHCRSLHIRTIRWQIRVFLVISLVQDSGV